MRRSEITAMVLTLDEEPNIRRLLEGLVTLPRVVIVDSGSQDATRAICSEFSNVEVFERQFDSFASQANYGLSLVQSPWVLSLDADYVVPVCLWDEVDGLPESEGVGGYSVGFQYCVYGRGLRGSLYPPRTVFYQRIGARYHDDGHAHRVRVQGEVRHLQSQFLHDDRKPLRRWFGSQIAYADQEAKKLAFGGRELNLADRIRRTGWGGPPAVLLWCCLRHGLLWDGLPGIFYILQRVCAETLLALALLDLRLRNHK